MDVRPFSPIRSKHKFCWGFGTALQWAFLEWLLMLMLFIDATISYLVTKFARYSELQIPCLICSRLDNVIGKESVGFYWDLVCENHKLEIHKKHVFVHGTMLKIGDLSVSSVNKCDAEESCILLTSNGGSIMGKNGFDHLSCKECTSSAVSPQAVNPKDNFNVPHEQLITDCLSTEKLIGRDSIFAPTVHEVLKPISFDERVPRETSDSLEAGINIGKKLVIGTNPVKNTAGLQIPNHLDLGDAYKLAVGNNRRQLSGKFSEQISLKESLSLNEDLKLLLSQRSFARGISLERNESGLSVDGSTISDIEGETLVDRLKRQVEHDRKLIGALYKELDEERNASEIASNQAMAMITRLQEEKAALNMEALQCLRVMEDQADYDVQALEEANRIIEEKEIRIRNIEVELEVYRRKFGYISSLEDSCERNSSEIL